MKLRTVQIDGELVEVRLAKRKVVLAGKTYRLSSGFYYRVYQGKLVVVGPMGIGCEFSPTMKLP